MQQSFSNFSLPPAIPNLVEIQLNSFQWFLDRGLRELFHNFSPIEDFTGNREKPLYDTQFAADRIRAARAAADAGGQPFVLVGRTDVLLVGGSVAESIQRANEYLAAGAHCAFVPGASDAATIGTLVSELDGPLNVVMGLTGALSLEDLRELGVRRVTVGGSIARAMYRHLLDAAKELAQTGTFSYAANQISQNDLNGLFAPRR